MTQYEHKVEVYQYDAETWATVNASFDSKEEAKEWILRKVGEAIDRGFVTKAYRVRQVSKADVCC